MGMRHAIEAQDRGTRTRVLGSSSTTRPGNERSFAFFSLSTLLLLVVWVVVAGLPMRSAAETSPAEAVPAAPAPYLALERSEALEVLLEVPNLTPSRVEQTDASLITAAQAGTNPELRKKSAFRKRSVDLFRTERDIEILRQEMQLRFRVRPKTRETMSVELRF